MKETCTEPTDWPTGQQGWLEAAYRFSLEKEMDENM